MMETRYRQPNVELINQFDEKLNAWIISRPYLNHEDVNIKDIEKMDLPLNGFAHYVLKFTCSLYFRDLMLSIRPIVPWCRSQRTIPFDTDNLFLSGEYENVNNEYLQEKMSEVYEDLKNHVPQDYAKKKLPMACSTEATVSMDDRTLIAFVKVLQLHCKDLYEVYGKLILKAIGKDESYINERNCKDIFDKLKVSDNEMKYVGTTSECMDMFHGCYRISNNLMAQFIRQHYSTVKNELFNKIDGASLYDISTELCNDDTIVVLYADKNAFSKVLSVRSCWFAQFDKEDSSSWSSVVGPYVKNLKPAEFLALLPCKGNCERCGIKKDMEPRMDCIEVNPPCPILTQKPDLIEFRQNKYGSNSEIFKKWVELRDSDMIKDVPNNPNRIRYETAIKEKGLPE